jgi:hypothetical protein
VRLHPRALVAAVALTAALVAPAQVGPAEATPADGSGPTASTPAAAQALADAQALFAPPVATFSRGTTASAAMPSRDATMVLRRLRLERSDLSTTQRASADVLLARPSTDRTECFDAVCVHWSVSGPDAASPGYVDQVAATAQSVLTEYAAAGYRAPRSDGSRGGSPLLDIYLEDLGHEGLYGYCDTDSPPTGPGADTWAYCAFDNDYQEFPSHTPSENLEVTAAHELFHAVQFAYDYDEDPWFMEATATWAEDELYDEIDDNLQYLGASPLGQPGTSMDRFEGYGLRQYGDWIFFRYLTERYTGAEGAMPTLVRSLWERADAASGGADDYSVQAVAKELASRGTSLGRVFADFAAANRRPGASYEEGAANHYAAARLAGRSTISAGHRQAGAHPTVDHLASATYRFTNGASGAHRLRLELDLPPTARGSAARVAVARTSGRPVVTAVRLSRLGDATVRLPFGRRVPYVEVSLVNASIRYRCGARPEGGFSCAGRALDDDLRMSVRATLS